MNRNEEQNGSGEIKGQAKKKSNTPGSGPLLQQAYVSLYLDILFYLYFIDSLITFDLLHSIYCMISLFIFVICNIKQNI